MVTEAAETLGVDSGPAQKHSGEIVRVNSHAGLAYICDAVSAEHYPFTFDKLQGYAGQPAKEVGLLAGSKVVYYVHMEKVQRVSVSQKK